MNKAVLIISVLLLSAISCQIITLQELQGGYSKSSQTSTSTAPQKTTPPSSTPPSSTPPPSPAQTDQTSSQFMRLRDVMLENETVSQTFARLSPKLTSDISIPQDSKNRRRLLVERPEVESAIEQFQTPKSLEDSDILLTTEDGTLGTKQCNFKEMKYSMSGNEFLHVDSSYTNIYPGSVLQSKYLNRVLNGTESQVPVPAGSNIKNPTITYFDQMNVKSVTTKYNMGDISRRISGSVLLAMPQNKDYNIYFEMGTSDDLSYFANKLSFNNALFKKIGLYRQPGVALTQFKKKIIFVFTKPIGVFNIVIESPNEEFENSPLNTFYSSQLTYEKFKSRVPSWWSKTNPPVYIDSVTYGSLIVLTVDYNTATSELYEQFQKKIGKVDEFQQIINQIVSQPSIKVFSRGPFSTIELTAIRDGTWLNPFFRVPNGIENVVINPLLYRVKTFTQQKYQAVNEFNYVKVCASDFKPTPPRQIWIKLDYILNQAPVVVTLQTLEGHQVFKLYFYCASVYNLTPYLNEAEMIVTIRPTVSPKRRKQVKAGFIVNGKYIHKFQILCSVNCAESQGQIYRINKESFQITDED